MNPKISDQTIDDYLMGKLSKEESEAFEIEVFGSPELLKEVQIREEIIGLIKNERETLIAGYEQQKSTKQKSSILVSISSFIQNLQKGWIYAGVAVAVLLILMLITPQFFDRDTAHVDLANFSENPRLESLLKTKTRSTDVSVSVISPEIGENYINDIVFQWRLTKDGDFAGSVDLKILNNKEHIVHSSEVTKGQYKLAKLEPGLYYWTIEHGREMLYLGKFLVEAPEDH